MDQQNPNNTPDGSGDVPLKRKRGRPRKYPRPDSEESSYMLFGQNKKPNPGSGEQTSLPPGYEGFNGNQQLQRDQENGSNDAMVGKAVSGLIEAVFDAGYLLNVRVGDSDTTLRGLVFKPGRYVPISSENDVAPGVPMIRRNEVPFPSGTTSQVQNPLLRERNQQHVNVHRNESLTMNGSPIVPQVSRGAVSPINMIASSGKNAPSSAAQTTPHLPSGNLVPALLQPDSFSNGVPISNQPSQVMAHISLGSGEIVSKEIPVGGNQAITSHTQTSQNMLPSSMSSEGVPHYQLSSNVLNGDGANSVRPPCLPFEHLVTEVVNRVQPPSDTMNTETDNNSGDKIPLKDPSIGKEDKTDDMDQPVPINPPQAVQSHPHENSTSLPTFSDYAKTGKMTELLQILQDNHIENQASITEELGSGNKLDDVRNLGTELKD
ncbi:hypothetical protein Lalb_Chr20g0113921 [Lupinus albus]|uniref:Uncharacterized protein n=1 Tax=Lupinus albus TaxID=3870 RepID=A0A6A4NWI2_LUPAL|nr:hypothetical protein Lalb_Chr20g0113921 [Lupinus albus]